MEPPPLDRSNYRDRIVYFNGYLKDVYRAHSHKLILIFKKGAGHVLSKETDTMVVLLLLVCMRERWLFELTAGRRYYPASQIFTTVNALGLDRFESASPF